MKKKFDKKTFAWEGVTPAKYEADNADGAGRTWRDTTRHIIKGKDEGGSFDVRYFEVAEGGFTSLECHEHIHSVICVRGRGYAIIGTTAAQLRPFDHVYVPSNTPHQFVNKSKAPFGFFCVVDAQRDRPRALTAAELALLQKSRRIAAKIRR